MTSISSSDGSVDEQGSAPITESRPRKSLDELLSSRRGKDGDFADMPSLSSFRADDMSAVTTTSYLSYASNSKGGDSRAGDDNASLPSLSSFRMEELSTCSSYHSLQTTVQAGDYPGDTWASFQIGNVSIDTKAEADNDKRRMKLGEIRMESEPSCASSPAIPALQTKGLLEQDVKRPQHEIASAISSMAPHETHYSSTLSNRLARKVIITSDHLVSDKTALEIFQGESLGSETRILASTTFNDPPTEESIGIEQAKSLESPSSEHRLRKNYVAGLVATDATNLGGSAEGLSSSLRAGGILLRLPSRRSSTAEVDGGKNEAFSDDEASQDASRLSDDSTRISSDDDVTHISDGEVSIGTGVESDISIETNAESDSMASDVSERSIIETQSVTPSEEPSAEPRRDAISAKTSGYEATSPGLLDDSNKHVIGIRTDEDVSEGHRAGLGPSNPLVNHEIQAVKETAETPVETIEKMAPTEEKSDEIAADGKALHAANHEERRRGLFRRVSSTLKGIGRSGSFLNSFHMVGKGASKLKRSASLKLPSRDVAASDKTLSGGTVL